jgi:hypothetical protein
MLTMMLPVKGGRAPNSRIGHLIRIASDVQEYTNDMNIERPYPPVGMTLIKVAVLYPGVALNHRFMYR